MTDPITTPKAHDYIYLHNKKVEVLAERTEGGGREWTVEQQQSPGYAGAYTVVKHEKLSTVGYRFHLWLPSHFEAFRPWLDTFRAGQKKRCPRSSARGPREG